MGNPAIKLATYEDILHLPENLIGEIINGRLESQPRPAPKNALSASGLSMEIGPPFQGKRGGTGGWWILFEPELHLEAHVLVPDLTSWRKQRMPKIPETAWFEMVPDWVCEILSSSTVKIDRTEKMTLYAALGVNHCWLIDPLLQTLETYQLHQGHWLLQHSLKDDAKVKAKPFDDYEFPLSNLWE